MSDPFLVELDTMIESTHEFIMDDELYKDPFLEDSRTRFTDLTALLHVRDLYIEAFQLPEDK